MENASETVMAGMSTGKVASTLPAMVFCVDGKMKFKCTVIMSIALHNIMGSSPLKPCQIYK